MLKICAQVTGWVYTILMGVMRFRTTTRTGSEAADRHGTRKLGPWGVYGEAIGNPKFYVGANPQDSEFLQADAEFAAAHKDYLRELAKY